jgi:Holliday junction DNA helicase RuvA
MIANLCGLLARKTTQSVVIDIGGIGYEIFVPLSTYYTLPEKDERVSLHVYTHVREDAFLLFGFQTELEKKLFMMLISVSGIGPKLAVNVLSGIGPEDLIRAIATGDALRLQSIPGVGRKTAERIALELKDKALQSMGEYQTSPPATSEEQSSPMVNDAMSALVNLGYSPKPAKAAVEKARSTMQRASLENLIKGALKVLASASK